MRADHVFVDLHAEYRSAWSVFSSASEALQSLEYVGADNQAQEFAKASVLCAEERYRHARNLLAEYILEHSSQNALAACC